MKTRTGGAAAPHNAVFVKRVAAVLVTMAIAMGAGATRAAESAPDRQSERFDLLELRVLGNTLLSPMQIEKATYPWLGQQKTLADIEAARGALESAYKSAGYATVFVDIPEQDVGADGVVRLRVTEGRVDRVRITGARYFENRRLRASLPSLVAGEAPHLPTVQQQLASANSESRDRSITPIMKAGRTPGAIDIELKVQDELPVHGALELNDRYTADTSKTRVNLNLSYDNLWQRFHSLSVQYQTAPEEPQEARVVAATYMAPLAESDHVIALYGVDTNSDVATIGSLSVLGAGRIYGARYIIPLPRGEQLFHSLSLGGDYKDFAENIELPDGGADQTPIEYGSWSVGYNGSTRTRSTVTSFNLGVSFGVRGLGNDPAEFEYKRYLAKPNFYYLRGGAEHERAFVWRSRLFLRAAGQFTSEPLISNEQYSIGGAESVRGYLESEALGDYGANATIEWRTPSFAPLMERAATDLYLFAFVDAGVVAINEALPGQATRTELSSTGLGVRYSGFGGLEAGIDGAYTLRATDRTDAYDTRVHFQIRYGF